MNVVMAADERDEPGHLFTFDVSGQHVMYSPEPRLRKTRHAHLLAPVDWRCNACHDVNPVIS